MINKKSLRHILLSKQFCSNVRNPLYWSVGGLVNKKTTNDISIFIQENILSQVYIAVEMEITRFINGSEINKLNHSKKQKEMLIKELLK